MTRNAIIMAAGTSSRFVPLSNEIPKGLLEVKGERLVERQIRQLLEAGVQDITLVTGYKGEMFRYLRERYGVSLVDNPDYARYNNISSIRRVTDRLGDTFICSSDNYFPGNIFLDSPQSCHYSALYDSGPTDEYCLGIDAGDRITGVTVGGQDSWYMTGPAFFSREFSREFVKIMDRDYDDEETRKGYWEDLYIRNIESLPPMLIRRFDEGAIREFDTLDDLREFDGRYLTDSGSAVIRRLAVKLGCGEGSLTCFRRIPGGSDGHVFTFMKDGRGYVYNTQEDRLEML